MRPRAAVVAGLAALALVAAACNDDRTETAETGEPPTTEAPSTTAAPASTTTAPEAATAQPAIWPAPDVTFDDPVEAAQDFLDQVIGAGEAGEFREGDARSGEVDVLFAGEGGGEELVRSTLLLRRLGPDDSWFVIGAVNPNATVDTPLTGAEVDAGPLTVQGLARGFEGAATVSALAAGTAGPAIAEALVQGGALEDAEPYATSLDLTGVAPGEVITLLVRGGVGLETDPGDFAAIPVVVAG